MRKRVLAYISLTILMVLGNELHASTANAVLSSLRNDGGNTSLTTVKWGAVAALAPTDASTGPLTIGGVVRSTNAATGSYFTIRNVGTIQTLAVGLSLATSGTGSYTTNIDECLGGTWTESTGACVGGVITSVRTNSGAQTTSANWIKTINPSSNVRLRIQYVASNTRSVTAVINITVSRANIRAATNTNS